MTFRRLACCPRCGAAVGRAMPHAVEVRTELPLVDMGERTRDYGLSQDYTFEAEEWVRFEPCGCVVPPEENEALLEEARR